MCAICLRYDAVQARLQKLAETALEFRASILPRRTFSGDIGVKLEEQDGKSLLRFYLKSFGKITWPGEELNLRKVNDWIKAASDLIESLNDLEIDLNASAS